MWILLQYIKHKSTTLKMIKLKNYLYHIMLLQQRRSFIFKYGDYCNMEAVYNKAETLHKTIYHL